MKCHDWEELLQLYLDGADEFGKLDQHLGECADCSSQRSLLLGMITALERMHPPVSPAHLTDRIVDRILAEQRPIPRVPSRRRRWGYVPALAAAALVLLSLGLALQWPDRPGPSPSRLESNERVARLPGPVEGPVEDSMAEASKAFVSLTSRTANETIDRTRALLPLVRPTTLEPLSPMEESLEPPMTSLREATSTVSAGLAPVTNSARRAVGLFLRDLPLNTASSDKKPG